MSDIKPTSEVEEKYVIFTLNKQISVHFIRWLILDTDEYQYYLLVMGGRRCEGLSGVTKWSISRAAVCVDLLYRCMVGALSVCTVPVPCAESHAVISDELGSTTWLMAFLKLLMSGLYKVSDESPQIPATNCRITFSWNKMKEFHSTGY